MLLCASVVGSWLRAQEPPKKEPYETRTHVGEAMPAFSTPDLSGGSIDFAAFRGKVVVLNFWATWCAPCRAEIPRLEKEVWGKFKSDRFLVIGISRGEKKDVVEKYVRERGLTYRIGLDPERRVYDRFASAGIPRTYVVNSNGTIVFQSVGYDPGEFERMKQAVESALAR